MTRVDSLFKAFAHFEKPRVNTQLVLKSILDAFAGDDQYIGMMLKAKIPMDLTQFVQFFKDYELSAHYLNMEEVAAMGDQFCRQ